MEQNAYALHNITPIEGASIFFTSFKSQWLLERGVGLATQFCFEQIPRNRIGTVSVIPRKKVLIPRHSEVFGRVNFEARNGRNMKKICFTKNTAPSAGGPVRET
jgi:hypothetical protein